MTEQTAHIMFQEVILRSDAYFDLHGSGLYQALPPHVGCQRVGKAEVDAKSEALARLFEIDLVNVMGKGVDEYSVTDEEHGLHFVGIDNDLTAVGNAALAGIPAVLLEVGRGGSLDLDLVDLEVRGFSNVLRYLGMLEGEANTELPHTTCYGMYRLRSRYGGLFFPAIRPGDVVKAGDRLGDMLDLRGKVIASLPSPIDALILMLDTSPSKTSGEKLLNFATLEPPPTLQR
jgi:predicted deacylase